MRALITGITGQDGFFLTKFLLDKNYTIFGLVRDKSGEKAIKFLRQFPGVILLEGDLANIESLIKILNKSNPDEIYNLGALSFVAESFRDPKLTENITGRGTLRLLEAIRINRLEQKIKFFQASSSEMFGNIKESPQNEVSQFSPNSPYGVAKTFAHESCMNYKNNYSLNISAGILFNHESEHRGYNYVTRKITSNLARIKLGKQKNFSLGSLETKRDWGYAGDYVKAMWLMLQKNDMDNYVIASGESHSVSEFLSIALKTVGLDSDINKYVYFDKKLLRPVDTVHLVGDSTKAKISLNWEPATSFREMIEIMIENDLRIEHQKSNY